MQATSDLSKQMSVLSVCMWVSQITKEIGHALSYYPNSQDTFYAAKNGEDILAVREYLSNLPDSSTLPIRGRDWKPDGELEDVKTFFLNSQEH
jgi:hypothetical protein